MGLPQALAEVLQVRPVEAWEEVPQVQAIVDLEQAEAMGPASAGW